MDKKLPVILAISAASGSVYGIGMLEFLLEHEYKVELIISKNAYQIFKHELGIELLHDQQSIKTALLNHLNLNGKKEFLKVWLNDDLLANTASGSYRSAGMIIMPASMSTVAAVACGISDNLIERTADVMIKEGRKLVIVPRETPFSQIHLENMLKLSKAGVAIVPPIPAFYGKTQTVDDVINFAIGKVLDVMGIENHIFKRWENE
jgi:4-hydroxy-3-polyprenylbenzoate decarboxylase